MGRSRSSPDVVQPITERGSECFEHGETEPCDSSPAHAPATPRLRRGPGDTERSRRTRAASHALCGSDPARHRGRSPPRERCPRPQASSPAASPVPHTWDASCPTRPSHSTRAPEPRSTIPAGCPRAVPENRRPRSAPEPSRRATSRTHQLSCRSDLLHRRPPRPPFEPAAATVATRLEGLDARLGEAKADAPWRVLEPEVSDAVDTAVAHPEPCPEAGSPRPGRSGPSSRP